MHTNRPSTSGEVVGAKARKKSRAAGRRRAAIKPQVEILEGRSLPSNNVISGFVYHDANVNGLYDANETPIANSNIELHNSAGTVVATAVTDAKGYYQFTIDNTIDITPKTLTYTAVFPTTPTDFRADK